MTQFLTTQQAAGRLSLDQSRIRQLIATGELAAVKHGRDWLVSAEAVEARRKQKLAGLIRRGPKPKSKEQTNG